VGDFYEIVATLTPGESMATNGLSMKLLIDTKAQRVCFAEAGSDVFELLSCLLCLPMSTAINLLTKERMAGSIGNVLASVQDLDAKFLISSMSKEPYLNPAVAPTALRPLQQLLDAPLNASTKFFLYMRREKGLLRRPASLWLFFCCQRQQMPVLLQDIGHADEACQTQRLCCWDGNVHDHG
jgi:hypothetical protein